MRRVVEKLVYMINSFDKMQMLMLAFMASMFIILLISILSATLNLQQYELQIVSTIAVLQMMVIVFLIALLFI